MGAALKSGVRKLVSYSNLSVQFGTWRPGRVTYKQLWPTSCFVCCRLHNPAVSTDEISTLATLIIHAAKWPLEATECTHIYKQKQPSGLWICAGRYLSGCQNLESNSFSNHICNKRAIAANSGNNVSTDWSGRLARNRDARLCVH